MKLETRLAPYRVPSRQARRDFPPHEAPAAETLAKAAILARLTEANGSSQPPPRPAPEITAATVRGMRPMQALDAVNGSTLDPLRHRGGQ